MPLRCSVCVGASGRGDTLWFYCAVASKERAPHEGDACVKAGSGGEYKREFGDVITPQRYANPAAHGVEDRQITAAAPAWDTPRR